MSMLLDTIADPVNSGRQGLPARPAGAAPYALAGLFRARNRDIALLAVNRASDRLHPGRTAARRADRRALVGRPDAAEAVRTDRARIRGLRCAKMFDN